LSAKLVDRDNADLSRSSDAATPPSFAARSIPESIWDPFFAIAELKQKARLAARESHHAKLVLSC
jgi:hypothetical protein